MGEVLHRQTCRVERWRGYFASSFVVRLPDGALVESSRFKWRHADAPPKDGPALAAYEELVERVAALGWERAEDGPYWFATEFARFVEAPAESEPIEPEAASPTPSGNVAPPPLVVERAAPAPPAPQPAAQPPKTRPPKASPRRTRPEPVAPAPAVQVAPPPVVAERAAPAPPPPQPAAQPPKPKPQTASPRRTRPEPVSPTPAAYVAPPPVVAERAAPAPPAPQPAAQPPKTKPPRARPPRMRPPRMRPTLAGLPLLLRRMRARAAQPAAEHRRVRIPGVVPVVLCIGVVAAVWGVAIHTLTTPEPAPVRGQPDAVVWGDRVFANRADFARWLSSRGLSYRAWAKKHPDGVRIISGKAPAPARRAASRSRSASHAAKSRASKSHATKTRATKSGHSARTLVAYLLIGLTATAAVGLLAVRVIA